jgi:hypothetical protein
MKKKQWVAPSVVAGFLLGSVMTAQVLYENNMLPSFRGIASDEVVTEVVENNEVSENSSEVVENSEDSESQEITEYTLEDLRSSIDKKVADASEIKKEILEAVELIKNEELNSTEVQEIFDTKLTPSMEKFNTFYSNTTLLDALNGFGDTTITFTSDVTDEIKGELIKKVADSFTLIDETVRENGEHLYDDNVNARISKLKDKEIEEKLAVQEAKLEEAKAEAAKASAKVEDLKVKVCEQTNKIDDLIEKVEKLVKPAQSLTDDLNYSYGLMDYFGMQNSMMGMYMNPMMMYSPFSMSMMSPYSMFMNPYSMSMMAPYSMGLSSYRNLPGVGIGTPFSTKAVEGLSEMDDFEKDYYGLQGPVSQPRVNDSVYGINYNDLRLGNDFTGNVNLEGGQNLVKVPQYSRSVATDVQSIPLVQ